MKNRLFIIFFLSACAQKPVDPLANTKRLVKSGHTSLYQNGAFLVPGTTVHLIPAGPTPFTMASEMVGGRAKASFLKAIKGAKDSVQIVADGTQKSFQVAGELSERGRVARQFIQDNARPNSKLIIYNSSDLAKELIGKSWSHGKSLSQSLREMAVKIKQGGESYSAQSGIDSALQNKRNIEAKANIQAKENSELFDKKFSELKSQYVLAMASIPKKLKNNYSEYEASSSLKRFSESYDKVAKDRAEFSNQVAVHISTSGPRAKAAVVKNLNKAKDELEVNSERQGYTLSLLKALGQGLKGIVWDGLLVPTGEIVGGGLGYVLYNGVAFPALVVVSSIDSTAYAVAEGSWLVGNQVYEVVAPNIEATFAASLEAAKFLGSKTILAGTQLEAKGQSAVVMMSETGEFLVKSSAKVAEGAITYIGVPVVQVVGTTGSIVSGVIAGVGGATIGASHAAVTEVGALTVDVGHKVVAGGVAITGTAVSVAAGAGVAVYEVVSGTLVPASWTLGSGIVLTYGTLLHLSAHTLLAASDAAYLVLSMEGPNYVLYSIKGIVGKEEDFEAGTILDLEQLRVQGEEIKKIPISDEEIKAIIQESLKNLPSDRP